MRKEYFHEIIIAIMIIGFAIIIYQNQIILNSMIPQASEETVIDRLMILPEMQEFNDYEGHIEYLTYEQVLELAEEYPDIYGGIDTDIYRIQLVGEKNIIVLYDDTRGEIINMFELMTAEVDQ